jgi:cell division protein FtsB
MIDDIHPAPAKSSQLPAVWIVVPQILTGLIFFVAIGISLTAFRPQMAEQAALNAEISQLKRSIQSAEKQKSEKTQQLAWLKVDQEYMEIQARDLLGWSLPTEEVISFDDRNQRVILPKQ